MSRRSGVSPELLRAWERRYALLRPARSPGGLRLYSGEDLERVRTMQEHLAAGLAASEAAALAIRPAADAPSALQPGATRAELADALEAFDEPRAQSVLDGMLATMRLDTVLAEIVLPYLHELGRRWERGEVSVAQEHFASGLLRARLLGLARDWGLGVGPVALLACLPGEQHDIGLIAFGLALRLRGFRIVYLGSDTPVDTLLQAWQLISPRLIVLSAVTAARVGPVREQLTTLAGAARLALGGRAALEADLEPSRLTTLTGDAVSEAERVAAGISEL